MGFCSLTRTDRHKSWGFSALCQHDALWPLILSGGSFPSLREFLHTHELVSTHLTTFREQSAHPQSSLGRSFLSDADLWIPAATVSLEVQFCLLSSWSLPGSVRCPRPVLCPGNSLGTVHWSNCRTPPFCFPSLRDHTVPYCLMFGVLETAIFYILSIFLVYLGERVNLPITLSWPDV